MFPVDIGEPSSLTFYFGKILHIDYVLPPYFQEQL